MHIYSKLSQEKKFYVYVWLRSSNSINGDIGTPYYIGKGQKQRAFDRCRLFIPKDPQFIKLISEHMNEADAFQLEMLLIYLHGRLDSGTGILKNLNEGGFQPPNAKGKKWFTNGTIFTMAHECPIGFKPGVPEEMVKRNKFNSKNRLGKPGISPIQDVRDDIAATLTDFFNKNPLPKKVKVRSRVSTGSGRYKRTDEQEEERQRLYEAQRGKKWFSNGEYAVLRKECPDNFHPGRR